MTRHAFTDSRRVPDDRVVVKNVDGIRDVSPEPMGARKSLWDKEDRLG